MLRATKYFLNILLGNGLQDPLSLRGSKLQAYLILSLYFKYLLGFNKRIGSWNNLVNSFETLNRFYIMLIDTDKIWRNPDCFLVGKALHYEYDFFFGKFLITAFNDKIFLTFNDTERLDSFNLYSIESGELAKKVVGLSREITDLSIKCFHAKTAENVKHSTNNDQCATSNFQL